MKRVYAFIICLAVFNNLFTQSIGGTVGGSTTVCSGTNSGLLTLSGHTGSVVRWQSSTTSGASWTNISNTTVNLAYANLNTTTWYRAEILLSPSPPNIADYSVPAIITVDAASSATINQSTSVCYGSNSGTLSISGTFTNVAGWDSSTDAGLNWIPIASTSTTRNFLNLTTTTLYRATVTNGVCPSANATTATVSVNPISIGGSVSGGTTVCSGSNSGTLTLNGQTGNIIRWQYSTDGGVSWSNISNTSSTNNFSNITETTEFRAVVQSGNCISANSSSGTITVIPTSEGGKISSDATVCSSINNGTLELNDYTGNIIHWESSANSGSNWTVINNTSDKYTYFNLSATTLFRVLVKRGSCFPAYSTPATISVTTASVGGTVSGNDTVCNGSNSGTLALSGYTGNVVRWQSSTDGGVSWSNIGSTSGTTACNFSNIISTTDFRAVVQNGVCPSANSSHARITVLPVSDGGTLSPATYSACSGMNKGTISLGGQSGKILRWESSIDGGNTWSAFNNTSNTQNFNNLVSTITYRVFVQKGKCAGAYSTTSLISVYPSTIAGFISGSDIVCTGINNGSLNLSGFTGNILYWEYSKNGGVTWNNISNTSTMQYYTNLTTTTMYKAVIQSGSCSTANSSAATITVNPITVGGSVLSSTYICSSLTSGTLTLSGYTGNILSWKYSTNGGSTWTNIANTTNKQLYTGISSATMFKAMVQSPGCTTEASASATISLAKPVVASYSFTTNGGTVIFTNTSTSNGGTSSWNFGDNTISAITNPAHTYIANGSYSVRLIVSDSCGTDTTTHTIIIAGLGINELTYNNPNVKIYPNPFSTTATIQMDFDIPTAVILKMFDIYGKEIRSINIERGIKTLKLERGDIPSGIYFYKLQSTGETRATGKIVIQ